MYGKIPQQTIVSFVLYFTSFPTQYNCKATSRYILTQTYELTKNRRKKTTKRNDKGNDCEQTGTCRWSYHFDASAHHVNKTPTCGSPEDIAWSILTFPFDSLVMNFHILFVISLADTNAQILSGQGVKTRDWVDSLAYVLHFVACARRSSESPLVLH